MSGLAYLVWSSYFQTDMTNPFSLPYVVEVDPLTYTRKEYMTEDDIWETVDMIVEVNKGTSRSVGQDLFHLVPLFTNPSYIVTPQSTEYLHEFNLLRTFPNISMGIIDDIPAHKLDCFTVISNEYNSALKFERKQNGN